MAHLRLLVVVAAALVASTRGEWNTTSVVLDPLARRLGLADEGAVKSWRAAVDEGQKAILKLYQAKHEDFLDITFYDDKQGAHRVRERLLRALVLSDTFVITIGGMSDVAGHGNLFSQSYPNVMKDALKAVFDKTPIKVRAKNKRPSASVPVVFTSFSPCALLSLPVQRPEHGHGRGALVPQQRVHDGHLRRGLGRDRVGLPHGRARRRQGRAVHQAGAHAPARAVDRV